MANEAVLRDRLANPIDFTVVNTSGIEKGTLCSINDPRTASGAFTYVGQPVAGIAAREKVASDGRTSLAMFTKGIFDMYASGAILVGEAVVNASTGTGAGGWPNYVMTLGSNNASGAAVIGYALETAADQEVVQIYVDIGGGAGHGGA